MEQQHIVHIVSTVWIKISVLLMIVATTSAISISENMSKSILGRVILSLSFAAALYPLTFTWFSRGAVAGWTGHILIDTLFSFFVLAYYAGLWTTRQRAVQFQTIMHVIWLLLYARMFFIFPQRACLDDRINLSQSVQCVSAGFYLACMVSTLHMGFALVCSRRFIHCPQGSDS